jgi:branched-chain amino acid transport system permease protein
VLVQLSSLRKGPFAEVIGFILVLGTMLLLPSLGASNRILYLAVIVVIWSIVSYGLFLPFALAGQMTVATITVFGAASFTVALAANNWGWNLDRLIPLGIFAGMVAGAVFALPVLRTSGHYFVVVTFAVAELGVIFGHNWHRIYQNDSGVTVPTLPELFGWHLTSRQDMMHLVTACLAVVFVALIVLKHTRLGRRFAALRENEQLARTVGCPVNIYKVLAFTLGGAIAGLAAPLNVLYIQHIDVDNFGVTPGIIIVVIVVLGGRKYVLGPVFGALFWYLGPELIGIDALLGQALFGAALAVVIIVAPDGLVAGVLSIFRFIGRAIGLVHKPSPPTEPVGAVSGAAPEPAAVASGANPVPDQPVEGDVTEVVR